MTDQNKAKSLMDYNTLILPRLKEICEPLHLFGISNFAYGKITKDRKYFRIGNHEKYTDLFYNHTLFDQHNCYRGLATDQTFENEPQSRVYVWGADKNFTYEDMRLAANMWNGISFYYTTSDYIETWAVGGTPEDTQLIDFYINNMDLLSKFINYFKNAAKDIIDLSDKNKTIDIKFHKPTSHFLEPYAEKIDEFNNRISIKNQQLSGRHGAFLLSPREIECLYYKSQGMTAKEIGIICNISHRTVETYINSMKQKSGLKNINQVICLSKDSGFL